MEHLLAEAQMFEKNNNWTKAEDRYKELLKKSPNDFMILEQYVNCLRKMSQQEKALDVLVEHYAYMENQDKAATANLIYDWYYEPFIETLKVCYEKNRLNLSNYVYNYMKPIPEFDELEFLCIPRNGYECYVFYRELDEFWLLRAQDGENLIKSSNCKMAQVVLTDIAAASALQILHQETYDISWVNEFKTPLYLVWQTQDYLAYLQFQDYSSLLETKRFVFFTDYEAEFNEYFDDKRNWMFQHWIGFSKNDETIKLLKKIGQKRIEEHDTRLQIINSRASNYNKLYYRTLFKGPPDRIRILFYTSKFTRVVQHSTRALMRACEARGITCKLLIEDEEIQYAGNEALSEAIEKFEPNVIFRINFLRDDFIGIPKEIMFWTWFQDPSVHFADAETAKKFTWNDFAIALPDFHRQMKNIGYDKKRIMQQIMVVDRFDFYSRQLSKKEMEFYKSDIALPSNYNVPGDALANLINSLYEQGGSVEQPGKFMLMLSRVLVRAYDTFRTQIEQGDLIVNEEQCADTINNIASDCEIAIPQPLLNMISREFYLVICYGLHRMVTLKWVIDSGYQLKLWGRDWETDKLLAEFSCGLLQPGDDLAKMYSATKIILATFSHYTGHFRVFEALACGALPMVRYVPDTNDKSNFRPEFIENKHFVFYYNKNDLLEKINYYLTHEEERMRIVSEGRKRTFEVATYEHAVKAFVRMVQKNMQP